MKDSIVYFFLGLSLMACNNENTQKDISNPSNVPKIDTISYELKSISQQFGDCEANEGKCTKTEVQYVRLQSDGHPSLNIINETLENTIKGNAPTIAASLDSFIAEAKAFYADFPDAVAGYASELEQKVVLNTSKIITIEEFGYAYTGGAHGNYGTSFYNFDVATGNLVTLNDLLEDGFELPLRTIAEPIFRAKYLEAGMAKYSAAGFYFENDEFILTDNFAITKEGLKFVYNPYEIAPYAMGQQEFVIPYASLEPILKKNEYLAELK